MMFIRRIGLAFALLLAPSFALASDCVSNSLITATGTSSCTIPASGVNTATFYVWGGGSGTLNTGPGGGGGFCLITLAVSPAQTINYHVAATATFFTGDLSWINISTSAQPSSASQGCYAAGGAITGAGGSGVFGSINHTGGSGFAGTNGGGGGGAGSGGNGGNGGSSSGGTGGSPDGGNGGSTSSRNGSNPGGGGGISGSNVGSGGRGQINIILSNSSSVTPFIFIPAVIP